MVCVNLLTTLFVIKKSMLGEYNSLHGGELDITPKTVSAGVTLLGGEEQTRDIPQNNQRTPRSPPMRVRKEAGVAAPKLSGGGTAESNTAVVLMVSLSLIILLGCVYYATRTRKPKK